MSLPFKLPAVLDVPKLIRDNVPVPWSGVLNCILATLMFVAVAAMLIQVATGSVVNTVQTTLAALASSKVQVQPPKTAPPVNAVALPYPAPLIAPQQTSTVAQKARKRVVQQKPLMSQESSVSQPTALGVYVAHDAQNAMVAGTEVHGISRGVEDHGDHSSIIGTKVYGEGSQAKLGETTKQPMSNIAPDGCPVRSMRVPIDGFYIGNTFNSDKPEDVVPICTHGDSFVGDNTFTVRQQAQDQQPAH